MFKKASLLAFLLTGIVLSGIGQTITKYSFTASSGTFTNLSGAISPALSAGTDDEGYFNGIPIGFDFWYMGNRYTTISASTNGWLTLGANITNATPVNNLTSGGTPRPILAPLWDDLELSPATKGSYLTSGTAGSRIFTMQFINVKWSKAASGNTISFQVKLYESTGKVEFVYNQLSGSTNAPSASIGIAAAATGSGNFLSVSNSGTSTSSTTEANITSKPISGNRYSFTSPVPVAPASLIFSTIASTAMTLNWSDLSSNETGFVIYKSTDGVTYTFATQTAANTTSSLQSGLTASTTYYWKIYSLSEGALCATPLSGTQATSCTQPSGPTVTSPINYCQNGTAIPLTATGSNLLWGGLSGSVGGSATLATSIYVDNTFNNKKTNFTTTAANVKIATVDYYIPSYQTVNGIVLSLYNSAGTVIATSTTNTTLSAGASTVKISNTFNYTLSAAGDYSIGVSAGSGNIGSDNPTFPVTESSGTISITSVSTAGYRCFNNIQFTTLTSSTAPTPSTAVVGTFTYYVSQTVSSCTSPLVPIVVNVTAPDISQLPSSGLIGNYKFNGDALDLSGNNNGLLQNTPATTTDRFNVANSAFSFNGSSQYVSTTKQYTSPAEFTLGAWFKTNSVTGGKLIGFGNTQTSASGIYDRHIYMNNSGQIYFGVYPGTWVTINSALSYNDNAWHYATASLSSTHGMTLYVDGVEVASDPATTAAESNTGYWKIGFDNLGGWPSRPTSLYFAGALDDVVIYNRELSSSEVDVLFRSSDGAGNSGPVCTGSSISLSATTKSGATYAWSGPNGFTSTAQNPSFTFTAASAGLYTVQVSAAGCSATAYTNVQTTTNAGQWTGNTSTDWANADNWCTGVVPTSTTNVVIPSSATRMPSIVSSVTCKNLTINAGATLTTSSAGTLNITGTLINSGTMTNNGTTNFNGTSGQQTFSGVNTFYNLSLSNSSGLLLPTAIVVNNDVSVSSGILNANNFGITVGGNWTNTGSVNAFAGGTAGVIFNGNTAQSIGGTFATTFNNLTIASVSNTVTLNINTNINGDLTVASGIFDLTTFTANHVTFAGTLTVANNATLKIGGTNTFPTNYTTNTLVVASTVEYSGTNQTVGTKTYGNLTLSSSSGNAVKSSPTSPFSIVGNFTLNKGAGTSTSFTAGTAITINGNVSIGAATTFSGSNYIHPIGGSWTNAGTFNGDNSTVTFTGPGSLVSGAGTQNFNNLTVGAPLITFSSGSITIAGNLATTGAGSFSQASGGTLLMTGSSKTISGSGISMDNLTVSGSVSSTASVDITGNLSVSGSFTASSATVTMSGTSKTISGTGTKNFGTLSVTGSVTTGVNFSIASGLSVGGSLSATAGTATFTGTSTLSGTANLFNTTLNGTSLQLSSSSVLGIANALTVTAGTLNVTSSVPNTVNFNSTGSQSVNAIAYNNLTLSGGNTKTAAGALTVNNSITIASGTTFNPGAFTHTIYVDWNNFGTFTTGTSTIQFLGGQNSTINGATTFNILTVNNSNASTGVILNSNVSAATVNMTLGTIFTDVNTLTITSTRTGNGIILGNIQRTHAFTTGVAYAFEGPDNTITFSSVSSVTSVNVSVAQEPIGDFTFSSSISRLYTITVPAGTYTATLRLHYEDDELNGNPESSMTLWNYNGTVWIPIGKTANNTTSNYIEQSGLTNITNRWTCSATPSVAQWNGSVSTDWNTAANWSVLFGGASTPPAATDVAVLGTATFTNQPTISSAVAVKNMVFGSAQAVTLSLASGGSLTSGDILGIWSGSAIHTINVNSQTMTVNGDLVLSSGTNNQSINLNIGAGTVNILGSLIESGNATINFSSTGTMHVQKDFHYSGGVFTAGSGLVVYDGDENQHVAHITYNNLTIDKAAGIATIDSVTNINGNLSISSGQLDNASALTISGNVTIASGTSFYNSDMIHVGGNWTNNGTYTGTGSHVKFNGSGTQTISASNFNNIVIDKPVGSVAMLAGNISINGDLTVTSGTFNIKTFDCNRTTQGGTLTLAAPATFIVGANNSPLNFSNGTLDNASTVIADGVGPQYIFGVEFGNLIFRNAGLKTLVAPITVNGDLTIESGATFDAGSETLTLNGNWINAGTFTPSASTLLWSGAPKTISGNTTFNRVTVNGSYTVLNDVTFNTLLHITSTGSLSGGASIYTTMNGDLINNGVLYTLGTTTFSGTVLQTLSLINAVQTVAITVNFNGTVSPVLNSTSAPQYGYLNINNTGGVNPSTGWTIAYALTVGSGASFNGGTSTHNLLGSLTNNGTITSSGTFNFIPATAKTLNFGTGFSSTGTVIFGGAGAITLAGTPVSFQNVIVSNTKNTGVTPTSNWTITNDFTVNSGSVLNASSYNYLVGGNLLNNGTINSGTSTFTLNGTDHQDVSTVSAFNNLTINKASNSVELFKNTTVNGVLNFVSGKIITGSNLLIQPSTGTVTGASQSTGWVNGNLQKGVTTGATTKTFDVGDALIYAPVTTAFSSVTGSGDLTVSTTGGDHPDVSNSGINTLKSVNRFWTLSNSGVAFTDYAATINFAATDIDAGATTSAFKMAIYDGSTWEVPITSSANATSIQSTGITVTGDFAIGENCNEGTTVAYAASPYCANAGTATVTLTGNSGGSYTSTSGLSINASTGAVNLSASTPGYYVITYSIAAASGCSAYSTTTDITISAAPSATISYPGTPFCSSSETAAVTLIGTAGGTFSSTTGLTLDATTGAVDLITSTAGTYTVTYSVAAAGGCSLYTTTTDITITTQPFATGTYEGNPYCSNGGIAFPTGYAVGLAGTLTSTSGLSIDAPTGVIDLAASTPGIYTVTYTVSAYGGCAQYSNTATVAISAAPSATISYATTPLCSTAGTATVTFSGTPGGVYSSTTGLVIDASTGTITPSASTPGSYTVTYTMAAFEGCSEQTATTSVTITDVPSATIAYTGSPYLNNAGIASVTFSGTTGGTYSSTAGLSIDAGTGAVNLSTSTPGTYTVTYTVSAAGGCSLYTTTGDVTILNVIAWDGGAGTVNWEDANNWTTDGLPTSTDVIDLTGANTIIINTSAVVNDLTLNNTGLTLTINSGASLSVSGDLTISAGVLNSNSQDFTLSGNWINYGTFNANNSTVEFNGTATQSISGSSVTNFNNILVTNTASPGVTVQSNQNLLGVLTLASNAVFDADGSNNTAIFKLTSTSDNPTMDAAIAALPSGAQVTGNVTVQRYMSIEGASGGRIYRYISSPVQNGTVADLQNEIPVTGSFTGTSTCSGCSVNQTLFGYTESVITDINGSGAADMNDGYFDFPANINTETMTPGRGYALYVRGNILSSALWDLRGTINAGNITPVSLPVTYTSSGTDASDGWNLIGNPFPSMIDWNASTGWTKENINGAIYVTDNSNGTTQYAAWNGLIGTNGGSRYIATGQAFWLKASGTGAAVLQADENVKTAGTQGIFFREAALQNLLRVTMIKGTTRDETVIHFRDDATEGFDTNADALKLSNGTINISSLLSDGRSLAINSLPTLNCQYEVKLNIAKPAVGAYQLDFSELDSFAGTTLINLVDNFTNTTVDIRAGKYNFSVTADAASYGVARFKLKFATPAVSSTFELSTSSICEGADGVLKIKNSQGNAEYVALIDNAPVSVAVVGNGGDVEISISNSTLQVGETSFTIRSTMAGCSTTAEKIIALTVQKRFDLTHVTSGSSCKDGAVILKASGAPSPGHYNWYSSASSLSPIINQHDSVFTTPFLSASKTYYVAVVNSLGCEDNRQPVEAKIGGLLDAQIIQSGDSLVSNYTVGNQWYFNNEVILGATNQSIKPDQNGLYSVHVMIDDCSTTGDYEFVVTGVEMSRRKMISVYPNPVLDKFVVNVSESFKDILEIRLLNNLGSVVGVLEWQKVEGRISGNFDMSNFASGIYILQVVGTSGIQEIKIVKQ